MFLRHIGKHGDRKVAIVFREVPGEPHMCLVTYPDVLNRHIHDPLMKCIESDIGQNSKNLADALNRTHTNDGIIILQKLHSEGMLKKVNTEQIVMTPAPNIKIKLNELNTILNEMEQGEAAVQKLAEMDASMGLQDPVDVAKRMRGNEAQNKDASRTASALDDAGIAQNLLDQASKMKNEAEGLLAEAQRLQKEAEELNPALKPKTTSRRTKKTGTTKKTTATKSKRESVN